jgi:hypothetical protein
LRQPRAPSWSPTLYRAFTAQITARKKELAALKVLVGEALLGAPGRGGGGLRGVRAAEAETLRAIGALEAEIELLKNRRWLCPTHLPLAEAGTAKDVALLEAKTVADAIKIAAYNAEEWLLERLGKQTDTTPIPMTFGICCATSRSSQGRSPRPLRRSPSALTHRTPPPTDEPWRGSAGSSTPCGLPSPGPIYRSATR